MTDGAGRRHYETKGQGRPTGVEPDPRNRDRGRYRQGSEMVDRTMCLGCNQRRSVQGSTRCRRCLEEHTSWNDSGWRKIRARVYTEETHCWLCGEFVEEKDRSVDHVVPRSQGGSNRRSNLKLAHRKCNSSKGSKN